MYFVVVVLLFYEFLVDCIVGGYYIFKGIMLFVNVWVMQNDFKVWDELRVFKFERFEGIKDEYKFGYKYIFFGFGRRVCFGENFVL